MNQTEYRYLSVTEKERELFLRQRNDLLLAARIAQRLLLGQGLKSPDLDAAIAKAEGVRS